MRSRVSASLLQSSLSSHHIHSIRANVHLQIPNAGRVIQRRVNFAHFLQISSVPHVQTVIVIHTGQPAVHRVKGQRHTVRVTGVGLSAEQVTEEHRTDQIVSVQRKSGETTDHRRDCNAADQQRTQITALTEIPETRDEDDEDDEITGPMHVICSYDTCVSYVAC